VIIKLTALFSFLATMYALWGFFLSIFFGALFALELSIASKILIAGISLLLLLIFFVLKRTNHLLLEILYYSRCNYITNETKRLAPENLKPSRDIIQEDIKGEQDFRKLEDVLSHAKGRDIALNIIGLIGFFLGLLATYLLLTEGNLDLQSFFQLTRSIN